MAHSLLPILVAETELVSGFLIMVSSPYPLGPTFCATSMTLAATSTLHLDGLQPGIIGKYPAMFANDLGLGVWGEPPARMTQHLVCV